MASLGTQHTFFQIYTFEWCLDNVMEILGELFFKNLLNYVF